MGNTSDKIKKLKKASGKPDKEQKKEQNSRGTSGNITTFLTQCETTIGKLAKITKNLDGEAVNNAAVKKAGEFLQKLDDVKDYMPENVTYKTASGKQLTGSFTDMCKWVSGTSKPKGGKLPQSIMTFFCFVIFGSYCAARLLNGDTDNLQPQANSKFQQVKDLIHGFASRSMQWTGVYNGVEQKVEMYTSQKTLLLNTKTVEESKNPEKIHPEKSVSEKTQRDPKPANSPWGNPYGKK